MFKRILLSLFMLIFVSVSIFGCSSSDSTKDTASDTVRLVYVQWACATATTHIIADILENKMGYNVELFDVAAGVMYESLRNDESDASFGAWLPVTHKEYMDRMGDQVENLGVNMEGARIGLVVPEYVDIDSIEDLNDAAEKFNAQIIGIDPGAGIMGSASQAIEDYDLNFTLVEGSDATMVATLQDAINNNQWIVVTGWTPHWIFGRWDLKYLDDPKNSFGKDETINTVVRQGLQQDMPDVYELCSNFKWTSDDLSRAMVIAEESGDPVAAARQWVQENPDLVNSWLPEQHKNN
ncbi:MAG: glycine betaine ABC transporter substrate-binding protein [Syntrophomonadaceae bacterium]|nr:glycine betaine ABC transporter substrate-binding protein [Syntrophomonadaceae bacterium]